MKIPFIVLSHQNKNQEIQTAYKNKLRQQIKTGTCPPCSGGSNNVAVTV